MPGEELAAPLSRGQALCERVSRPLYVQPTSPRREVALLWAGHSHRAALAELAPVLLVQGQGASQ